MCKEAYKILKAIVEVSEFVHMTECVEDWRATLDDLLETANEVCDFFALDDDDEKAAALLDEIMQS